MASATNRKEEADDGAGTHVSCSSSGEISHIEDDVMNQLHIADESALDGEVGKRLNEMVPIPVRIHWPCLLYPIFVEINT